MRSHLSVEGKQEWRSRWKLIVASFVGASSMSIAIPSFGAFMAPLEQTYGWTRGQISVGLTILALTGICVAPFVGGAVDRWGPRRFGVWGVLLIGLCFALLGTVSASIVHWYLLWLVFALVSQLSKGVVWSAAVSSEFRASRGMALGTILLGSGAGTIAAPLLAGYLINHLGWKLAYVVMGLGWGSIAWMFCYAYFYGRTDRLHGSVGNSLASADPLPGLSLRASLTSMRLLKLAVAALLGYVMIIGLWVHLIPILGEQGISRDRAIWISGLLGLSAMFGQLGSGLLADRLPGHLVFGALACLPVLTFSLLLMHSTSIPAVIVATLVIGLYGGASSQMYPYLTSRYFGLRAFGRIYSVISVVISIATGLGPLLAAYVYDQTRNYDPLLRSGIPVALACALLIVWLGRYPQEPAVGRRSDQVPGMDAEAVVAST